ncbi:MAG TPA: bifunctional diaminohydroxyphosphoribosylaminopyrimidine deaminase/5-amino-6-(5-phosphoribosylamino)uracil reductase RibD [Spirochaetota bacterium]|nr:bifunctional diaminohydroxyphosphoribosylaminopyrimidine deaminase/5-amino-6-(5-phosphoribosylamino)uracil reductase RibD [Spirochaetota bacterium]HOS33922.1 bifunctional diaminohydroxyphosphoribosylaminopyrimidine deaminase/5-amino-6-(5-phosphoribosylamino)uracil reductase RibD [Spirochaetota bacterium]HOS56879.1 bifunctional diaminohydroxyphosphoribosylaminopyrimidine deaminase/5-amino-6-(5-phosphoribosylamino)uracil reductase RibD [Spirochaetota bacterium]HPK62444.1 bifunctional diaminohyd
MQRKDEFYMSIALAEARKGLGFTSPNPMVGAVIVKNGKIISTGYHKRVGLSHAEIDAINNAPDKTALYGSTMYVNLEPCCHHGRTPPCVEAIIDNKIKSVVIGNLDIDKRVAGKGIAVLNNAGIRAKVGVLAEKDNELNSIYYFYKKNNRPYVVLKAALTLDGKIATVEGDSKWISNDNCRAIVAALRGRLKAVAIGKNTILKDNPRLNCRVDRLEQKPVDKLIFSNKSDEKIFSGFAPNDGRNFIIDKNISKNGNSLFEFCQTKEIDSILVEGGSKVYSWFLKNEIVDRVILFYKPSFLGNDGLSVVGDNNVKTIDQLKEFNVVSAKIVDNNFMIDMSKGEPLCLQV